jgi:hypothetical protein
MNERQLRIAQDFAARDRAERCSAIDRLPSWDWSAITRS